MVGSWPPVEKEPCGFVLFQSSGNPKKVSKPTNREATFALSLTQERRVSPLLTPNSRYVIGSASTAVLMYSYSS